MTRYLTEEEHEHLSDVGDIFWKQLGKLVAKCVAKFPPDLDETALAHLQDKCSVYGTEYTKYLKDMRS